MIDFLITLLILMFMTIYETFNMIKNYNHKKIKNIPLKFNGTTIQKNIDIINYNDISYDIIKKYIDKSIPFIIRNVPKKYKNDVQKYSINSVHNFPKNNIQLNQYFNPDIPNFYKFLTKYIKKNLLSMVQLNGNYKSGVAHIDFVSSYNVYFMHRGCKKVIIVPENYTKYFYMKKSIDNVFVANDLDMDNEEWLNNVPFYWSFILQENDILIFNNSKCIHKFQNLTTNSEVFSMRVFHSDSSYYIRKYNILNYNTALHFSKIILNKNIFRKEKLV